MRARDLWQALRPWLSHDGQPVHPVWRWGRLALLVALAVYTPRLVLDDMRSGAVMHRWIYRLCFVLHEAGHPIFSLFGPFLGALGGTLMQLLMPAAFVGDFLRRRHPFGAAVCLWWLGASLITVAPYVADARRLVLPLHGGGTGADRPMTHDWFNVLGRLDLLMWDIRLGWLCWGGAVALMAAALAWGGWLLWQQWRVPDGPPFA